MKAVTLYFQNLDPNLCFQRFALDVLPFLVDLTFGKILGTYMRSVTVGKQLDKNTNSLAHVQKFHFCKCPGECPLKNTEQITWKKLVIAKLN